MDRYPQMGSQTMEYISIPTRELEVLQDALTVAEINLHEALFECPNYMCGHCIEILAPLYDLVKASVGRVEEKPS